MDNADIRSAIATPVYVTVGDDRYTFEPVNLFDLAAFNLWISTTYNVELVGEKEWEKYSGQLPGMCWLLARSIRVHHPEMTDREIGRLFNLAHIPAASELLGRLMDLGKAEDKEGEVPGEAKTGEDGG